MLYQETVPVEQDCKQVELATCLNSTVSNETYCLIECLECSCHVFHVACIDHEMAQISVTKRVY